MRFCDLTVKARLTFGFGVILAVVGLSIALTAYSLAGIEDKSLQIKNDTLPYTVLADELAFDTVQVQQFLTDVSATHDPEGYQDAQEAAKGFLDGLAKFEAKSRRENDTKSLEAIADMRTDFARFYELGKKMANAYLTLGMTQGNVLMEDFDKTSASITAKVQKFRAVQIERGNSLTSATVATVKRVEGSSIAAGLFILALGLLVSFLISRSITVPLRETVRVIEGIAKGDMTVRAACDSKDELGALAAAVNLMAEETNRVLSSVVTASGRLAAASAELQSGSAQISANIEEVASQSSSVAHASGEMAETSGEIARNCARAAGSSAQVNGSAQRGSTIIQGTVQGMQQISDRVRQSAECVTKLGVQSEQIGEIIGTIEDIADQTNLLALNAAIEAARAGEQGRGFAVVADEVRALATRTTKATKDIGEMICAIQREIKEAVCGMDSGMEEAAKGTGEAAKSSAALDEILEQIGAVSGQINQIATAAEEQSATTTEVSRLLQQINRAVEESATGVQLSSAAAGQLAQIAEELQGEVRYFTLAV
jgi:methyl-accepting chemotaxis protein